MLTSADAWLLLFISASRVFLGWSAPATRVFLGWSASLAPEGEASVSFLLATCGIENKIEIEI